MKKFVLTVVGIAAMLAAPLASAQIVINSGEFDDEVAGLSAQPSSADLAEGVAVTDFHPGNGNGASSLLVDGAVGTLGFNNGGVNGSNGAAGIDIFLDLGSSQPLGIVNVFSAGANPGSTRQNQIFDLLGSNDPNVDINVNDLSTFTVIQSVSAINPGVAGDEGFGLTSLDLQGASFRFLALDATNIGTGGGGETSIFHEIDVFAGAAPAIPEPSSLALLGIFGLGLASRRRR